MRVGERVRVRVGERVWVCVCVRVTTCVCGSVRMHCSRCGAVRQHPSSVCPGCVLFCVWAVRWVPRGEAQRLPTPRGDIQRAATPDRFLADPLGARAEEVPDCSSCPLRILDRDGSSGLSIHACESPPFLNLRTSDSTSEQVVKGTSLVAVRQPDSEQIPETKLNQKGVLNGHSDLSFLKHRTTRASGHILPKAGKK